MIKKVILNVCLMILVGLLIAWLAMLWLGVWTRHGQSIAVPSVTAMPYDRAVTDLNDHGLTGIVADSVYDTRTRPGTVIDQNPKAGTTVKEGREVFLTINAFSPKMITLPALTDISVRQARSILEGLDITDIQEVRVPSDFKDLVLGVKYRGARLMPGARVPVNARVILEVGEGMPEEFLTDSAGEASDSAAMANDHLDLF